MLIAFSHEMKKNILSKQQSNTPLSLTLGFLKNIFNDVFDMKNFDFFYIFELEGGKRMLIATLIVTHNF